MVQAIRLSLVGMRFPPVVQTASVPLLAAATLLLAVLSQMAMAVRLQAVSLIVEPEYLHYLVQIRMVAQPHCHRELLILIMLQPLEQEHLHSTAVQLIIPAAAQ